MVCSLSERLAHHRKGSPMGKFQVKGTVASIALSAFLTSGMASAEPMRCEITSKFSCLPAGCASNQLGIYNLIDLDRRTISRCDQNGCDTYAANVTRSGAFFVVDVPGRGMLAKLSVDGADYVELATLGPGVLVSFGHCGRE